MQTSKVLIILGILSLMISTSSAASSVHPVRLQWGIPEEASQYFANLPRSVEGAEAELAGSRLSLRMHAGDTAVIPLYAVSDAELKGVRYLGTGIPSNTVLHWLEPFSGQWIALDQIPEEEVLVVIREGEATYDIDMGPPDEGAVFSDGIPRFIWFALTPSTPGSWTIEIFGYQGSEDHRVTTLLECTLEVAPEGKARRE